MTSDRLDLFPTTRAIPEDLQIGRAIFIRDVLKAVTHGGNVLLLEDRRTGKSSGAFAVIERLRNAQPPGDIGLMVDLSEGIGSSLDFAKALLREASEQEALKRAAQAKLSAASAVNTAKKIGRSRAQAGGKIAGALGEDEHLGEAVAELLAVGNGDGLRAVLEALEAHAGAAGKRVVIFIDEIQVLATWNDAAEAKAAIQAVSGRYSTALNFIFAGSEQSAVDAMFGENDPMDFFGDRMPLPEITDTAWRDRLIPRFKEAGLEIAPEQITQILLETDNHPGRTIHVCRQILQIVPGEMVNAAVVKQAINRHRNDPAWKRFRR